MSEKQDKPIVQPPSLGSRLLNSSIVKFIYSGYGHFLETQQVRISKNVEGLPLLALLGLLCGVFAGGIIILFRLLICLLYTSPSPRDLSTSRMPSSA